MQEIEIYLKFIGHFELPAPELTEELEELKTEKEMLLRSLDCADDVGISAVKKEIATRESALQKLSEQEAKYSAELDEALN